MPATAEHNPTPHPEMPHEGEVERSPISFLGGMGYDRERNQHVIDYIRRAFGRPAIAALANPDVRNAPKGYRVRSGIEERVMPRPFAYLETAKSDTVYIASRQQEARADELIAHIESQTTEPITHIAQSADAQNAIIAAHKRPDLFKNLVLLFPSGMVKKRYRTEYLRQIAGSLRDEKVPKT